MLSIIAVIGKNRELGKDNKLLWHIPGDLPRFKQLTTGHPVIMGRKTFQSIGRALPNRTNIVISTDTAYTADGVTVVSSIDEAVKQAESAVGSDEIFIIGGGSVYKQAIERADKLYLTVVDASAEADTYFPNYSDFTKVIASEAKEEGAYRFTYITLSR